MTTFNLMWQIMSRTALRILAVGALFGGIYGPSLICVQLVLYPPDGSGVLPALIITVLAAIVVGAFMGALLGLIVGTLVGLMIAVTTIWMFMPLYNAPRYVRLVRQSSALLGGVCTFVCSSLLVGSGIAAIASLLWSGRWDGLSLPQSVDEWVIIGIVPALLASLAIWRASEQVAMWYLRTATPTAAARRRDASVLS